MPQLTHLLYIFISVGSQDQKSRRTLSPSATKDSAQTPPTTSVPASAFCSEAQTCWSNARWDKAPASVREHRPPSFCFLLPLRSPFHVQSPAAPQGGGWTHLWGERLLSFLSASVSVSVLFIWPEISVDARWAPKNGPVIISYVLIIHVALCNVYSEGEAPNYPAEQKWQEQACRLGTSWNRHADGLLAGLSVRGTGRLGHTTAHQLFWLLQFGWSMRVWTRPNTGRKSASSHFM